MLEPSAIVLYVDNLLVSSAFYQDLLGIKPEEDSPTFHSFKLSNGMGLGLKAKHSVEPPTDENGSGELAFTLDNNREVDELFVEWQGKKISMAQQSPTVTFRGKDKLQSFTALGKIKEREPYQVDMVIFELDFTKNKKNWGYQFRFGLLAITDQEAMIIKPCKCPLTINKGDNLNASYTSHIKTC